MEEELELVRSSLLPAETVEQSATTPNQFTISSSDSPYRIRFTVGKSDETSTTLPLFQLTSDVMGKEEAVGWAQWVEEKLAESWEEAVGTGFPYFYMVSTYFLPVLQEHTLETPENRPSRDVASQQVAYQPGHLLFTSHHLLSPTKRRLLSSLSSSLHLKGFGKVGYPGIIYAQGDLADLEDFAREVKSWQWLALKLWVLESDKSDDRQTRPGRGEWQEVTKIGEALEWLKAVGKDYLLTDSGFGVNSSEKRK